MIYRWLEMICLAAGSYGHDKRARPVQCEGSQCMCVDRH
jgi:hypothetical protein